MKHIIRLFLIVLSIAALFQPLVGFYIFRGDFSFIYFAGIGCLSTLFLLMLSFVNTSLPRAFVWWSVLVFCLGLGTSSIPERWIYTADGLLLMAQREKVVKAIKTVAFTQNSYMYQGFWPLAIHNQVTIKLDQGVYHEISFPTRDASFLDTHVQGVLYSELPERAIAYHRTSEEGGVITEYHLKLRKIKARWYFYTFERSTIQD